MKHTGMYRLSAVALVLVLGSACSKSDSSSGASSSSSSSSSAKAGPKVIELEFAYGSEKKAWLTEAIEQFHNSPAAKTDSFQIRIKGVPMGSGVAITELVDQVAKPHIWSPASDAYRILLNRAWTAKHGAIGGATEVAADSKPLVLSPVVIAMWKPMAQALGWPDKPIGWSEILQLSTDPKGWATLGHPEWGLFKFGHTHPEFSNSGQLAVLAEAYAATGATTGLTAEKLASQDVQTYVREIESSIIHYGKSTGFFAEKMLSRGPAYLSAAVLYENLVIDSYKRPEFKDRVFDLVAIYPKEGTFWIDNPLVILDAPWVTADHKKAGAIFRDYLLSKPVQERAMSEYGFRPIDPSIAIGAPISAEFGVDPQQPKTLLDLPEASVIDAAMAMWKNNKKTVDLMFVFDRSGSMQGEPLTQAKQGAQDFLAMLDDRDRVSIVMFNHAVPTQIPEPVEVGKHRAALTSQIQNTFAEGGTALYGAIAASYDKLAEDAKKDPKRLFALVVLSDGVDESSQINYQTLAARIQPPAEQGVLVRLFTIAYGSGADPKVLQSIAEAGGGAFFSGDTKTIREVYRDLAAFF